MNSILQRVDRLSPPSDTNRTGRSLPIQYRIPGSYRQTIQLALDLGTPDDRPIAPVHPLKIEEIPIEERIHPDLRLRLIHTESGLRLPGQFTFSEISEIFFQSIGWDWSIDDKRRPACARQLLRLLEEIAGKENGDRPVRSIEGGEENV